MGRSRLSSDINQDDNEEKEHQIGRMADVYYLASTVLTYLGEGDTDDGSPRAFELIDQM